MKKYNETFLAKMFLRTPCSLILIVALCLAGPVARAGVIAHWSFDSSTISVDGSGSVVSATDDTGLHNATGVRNGTATSASVAGAFGEGLQLNNTAGAQAANNVYMTFPNLTELMGSTGPSYTVAAWVNTLNTADNNTILGDWGNAPSGDRFIYWFSVNNSSGQGRPRAQARAQNNPNDDIFAQQPAVNVASGTWRHIAWTFNKETATLKTYVDGALVDTLSSIAPPLHMTNSASALGTIGRKADNNRYFVGGLDEIWVLDEAIDDAAVLSLFSANVVPGATAPPAITRQPVDATVYVDGVTNLSVIASGAGQLSYTWYRGAEIIPGAISATLVLSNVSLADSGDYSVAITNNFGGVVSDVATVTVLATEVPTITQQPLSVTRYPGGAATFAVAATGAARFTYQWQWELFDIDGMTNATLTLTNIQDWEAGDYRVIVTSSAGATPSQEAVLTVLVPTNYAANVWGQGPAAYWRLNESSGPIAYEYIAGNDGTYSNVTVGVEGAPLGEPNTAAEFDSGVVTTGKGILNARAAFSIAGWIYPVDVQLNRSGLFGQNDVAEFGFINPTNIQIWTPSGGSLTVPYPYPAGEWHHVAAVASGTGLTIYFDGVSQGAGGTPTANYGSSAFGFNIGGGGIFDASTNFFRGRIDEVAVFTRALSAADVMDLYQTSLPEITIARTAEGVTLAWPTGTLQYTDEFSGDGSTTTWIDLPSATTPYPVSATEPQRFYRVRR